MPEETTVHYITVKVEAPSLEAAAREVGNAIDRYVDQPDRDSRTTFKATWPHINLTIDRREVNEMIQDLRTYRSAGAGRGARLTICDRAAELLERIRG